MKCLSGYTINTKKLFPPYKELFNKTLYCEVLFGKCHTIYSHRLAINNSESIRWNNQQDTKRALKGVPKCVLQMG